MVLHRPVELAALTGQMNFHRFWREAWMGREPNKSDGLSWFCPILQKQRLKMWEGYVEVTRKIASR